VRKVGHEVESLELLEFCFLEAVSSLGALEQPPRPRAQPLDSRDTGTGFCIGKLPHSSGRWRQTTEFGVLGQQVVGQLGAIVVPDRAHDLWVWVSPKTVTEKVVTVY
jgi:hypothetical protein